MMYTLEEIKAFGEVIKNEGLVPTISELIEYIENIEQEGRDTKESDQYDLETCHQV